MPGVVALALVAAPVEALEQVLAAHRLPPRRLPHEWQVRYLGPTAGVVQCLATL